MKVSNLIKALEKLIAKHGELDVIVDGDDNGYYECEEVEIFNDEEGNPFVNIKSSNEA